MLDLARAQGIRLPAETPAALADAMAVKHAKNLEEYLTKYAITLSVMQTAAALERIAYEFVQDAAAEHVRYVEVRYSPLLHRPALTLAQAIEAPLRGFDRPSRSRHQGGRDRVRDSDHAARDVARAGPGAADYRAAGVIAFDLAGRT